MSIQSTKPTTTRERVDKVLEQFHDPDERSIQGDDDQRRKPDAVKIRTADPQGHDYGPFDREPFSAFPDVVPNCLDHTWNPGPEEDSGGTDWLCAARPGAGKSTLANFLSQRLMELNNEKVVWRGSSSRSEWLPLAPWTKLCLPEGVDVHVTLRSKDPREPEVQLDVDVLEGNIVREVVRYSDPIDLNQNHLDQGQFHVVYPDPTMRQCQAIYEQSSEKVYETPSGREALFHAEDPASHWWFAWLLARVEYGPHHWTSWIADEIGDIAPQSVGKDSFGSYQKVELLRDTWVDARKFGVSVFAFGHSEEDIHSMIRRKIRWRVTMHGSGNPTSPSEVIGFSSIKMDSPNCAVDLDVGEALMYTERGYDWFGWEDMQTPTDYSILKIQMEDSR